MAALAGRQAQLHPDEVPDLSEIGTYAKVDNAVFRLLKAHTPGPYTFILNATSEVPRLLLHPKRRSIGVRVPDHRITHALLDALGEPLMSVTLIPVGEDLPMTDPEGIRDRFGAHLDAVIDGGACHLDPTTVVETRGGRLVVRRAAGRRRGRRAAGHETRGDHRVRARGAARDA